MDVDSDAFIELPDEQLVALCADSFERTRDIFSILYERHHVDLFNFLRRYVGNQHLAEDILQETFLRVFRNLQTFKPQKKLSDWIYTIALNAARDVLRRKHSYPLDPNLAVAAGTAGPADASSSRESQELLGKLILELPEEERAIFLLARVEGRKLQDVADVTGFSLRTVKNRLADALERLARQMTVLGVA